MNEQRQNSMLLDALTCRGVLASVNIRFWRARKKLTPEDLGLSYDKVDDRLISLGHKKLLPREKLQRLALVEGRAHSTLEENSFPFLGGIARYVPNERLEDVNGKLERMRVEFENEKARFLERYATYRDEALGDWRRAGGKLVGDPARLVAVIEDAFPPPEKMERYFEFNISLFEISTPEMPRAELLDAGSRREIMAAREKAAGEARHRIEQSCDEFIRESTAELRRQTSQLCSEMLETINTTGNIHQKTLNRLINFIDRFRELNFVNDTDMEEQLEQVRTRFLQRSAGEYRDSSSARGGLVQGLENLRNRANEMAGEDTTAIVEQFG